jgi:hypothetical protein
MLSLIANKMKSKRLSPLLGLQEQGRISRMQDRDANIMDMAEDKDVTIGVESELIPL